MDNGLSKKERISSVKAIENLIARGRYANLGVIRVCHCRRPDEAAEEEARTSAEAAIAARAAVEARSAAVEEAVAAVEAVVPEQGPTEVSLTEASLNRMMVSVPKKLFKRAVKRNLLKRRIREAYRLQKNLLAACSGIDMMFVYNSKEVADFATIYAAVGAALGKIAAKYGSADRHNAANGSAGIQDAENASAGGNDAANASAGSKETEEA